MATPQESSEEGMVCSILERHHSSLSQSMTSPYTVVNICQILYSKRCVDERTLNEVETVKASLEDKKRVLMISIYSRVSTDHRKLHELATVLEKFKETKSVAKNIISDYKTDHDKILGKLAKKAIERNTVDLTEAISGPGGFHSVVMSCTEKQLITSHVSEALTDSLIGRSTAERCADLIREIKKVVSFKPAHLDAFLCVLINTCGVPGTVVGESIARDYGHELPQYRNETSELRSEPATDTVGGATNVISSDDNVEEMVPQMSNEDRASDILRTHYSTLSQSLKDPVDIARLLHGENVISEDAVTQVESAAIKDRTTVLLRFVRKAVHGNHQHLNEFGRVLQQLTAGNGRVGQDILNDYNKFFTHKNEFTFPLDIEEHFTAIKAKFGILCNEIKDILILKNIPVDNFKSYCKFSNLCYSKQIDECQTMEDLLMFVANKCSTLINICIIKEFVKYRKITEAASAIETYEKAIDKFCGVIRQRFPLNLSLLPEGSPPPLRGETITFVMNWKPETVSLDDIKRLLTYAFRGYSSNIQIHIMKEGNSVTISCSFPFELTGLLMAEAMKNLKLLKKYGLLKLTIGYCTIWNIRDEEEKETTYVQSTNEDINNSLGIERPDDRKTSHQIKQLSQNREEQIVNEPHRPGFHREDSRQIPPAVPDQKENSCQTDELPENIVTKDSYQANHGRFLIFSCFVIITVAVVFIALFIGNNNKYYQEEIDTLKNGLTSCKEENEKCLYARDCKEWYEVHGITKSDIYPLKPDNGPSFKVYCDMESEGGGWTVFQRRQDGLVYFYRNWTDYEDGFGTLSSEHWLGLSKLHRLTLDTSNTLRVDLEDFDNKRRYAQYNTFQISDSNSQYAITVGGYSGTAGDSLEAHNSMKFSTKDRDNDEEPGDSCATKFKGAWWYSGCHESNLNGQYKKRSECITEKGHGLIWNTWKGYEYSLKFTEMKVRRN